MLNWTNALNLWRTSAPSPCLSDSADSRYFPDGHHIILDPEYANPRNQPGRFDSVYRDAEGNLHPLTYRPFPLLTPPPKRKPRERIAHFDKIRLRKEPCDVEAPYDPWLRQPVDDCPESELGGANLTETERWWPRLVGDMNGGNTDAFKRAKRLVRLFLAKFYDYLLGSREVTLT